MHNPFDVRSTINRIKSAVGVCELEWKAQVTVMAGQGLGGEYEWTAFSKGTVTPED